MTRLWNISIWFCVNVVPWHRSFHVIFQLMQTFLCNKAVIHFCGLFLICDVSGICFIYALILVLIDLFTFYTYSVSVRRLGSKHGRLHSNKFMKGHVDNIYFNNIPCINFMICMLIFPSDKSVASRTYEIWIFLFV